METRHKKSFTGFLSRSNADGTDTPSNETSCSPIAHIERGKLGLTTIHEPASSSLVVADIVFIHGLGGNSRKAWSLTTDPDHFWPKAWLPSDRDFTNTRIHVFGYNADWRDRQHSPLSIHDFAQSLVGELKNDPGIRKDVSPIILVGHSMGGCVAKKAYILARLDPNCKELVERIHSMFFLGTPHRGADLAPILENILTLVWGKKPFLQDLLSSSTVLAEINDSFRHYALDLRLWSFYETQPVKTMFLNKILVGKGSATLGYPNEEFAAMNADHRHLCKFDNRNDPNYRLLRNALHTVIDLIRDTREKHKPEQRVATNQSDSLAEEPLLDDFVRSMESFGIGDTFDDDLAILHLLKESGSCEWLTRGNAFSSWEDGTGPQIFWLIGRPATGKSVLSSHVVERLTEATRCCSYFFFKYGKRGKSTTSECLLSIAYQMALKDGSLRQDILRILEDQTAWDRTNETIVWRRLFIGAIFKSPSISNHSWVIDGIDECTNFSSLFTKRILATIPHELRIFATSRDLEEIGRGLTVLGTKVCRQVILEDDTLGDMRLFVSTKLKELDRIEADDERQAMSDKILKKSRGSFLWVRLVLDYFENAWTDEAMEAALRDVPADLNAVYIRMLLMIEADPRKTKLAKSILTWVVSASRLLTIDEIRCAIKLDTNETVQNLAKAISSICGQLVFIDHVGKVQIIHETARQFLLGADIRSELAVSKGEAHNRLSGLLLSYLSSGALELYAKGSQNMRTRGFSSSRAVAGTAPIDLALLPYACQFFSEHIYHSNSEDDGLAEGLYSFLKNHHLLYWIEYIAQKKILGNITHTAMNIGGYLERRTSYVSPNDPWVHLIDHWVIDLMRVAAKFRSQLLACPSSIYCLIPPLCPPQSIISKTFSNDPRLPSLGIKSLSNGGWDDCLARIDLEQGEMTALAYGMKVFAVGESTGAIKLYDTLSVQCVQKLDHPERIRLLHFSPNDELLVSCGTKQVIVWNLRSGARLLSFYCDSLPLAVLFLGSDELLMASQSSQLTKWNLETGELEVISWLMDDVFGYSPHVNPSQWPSRVTFSPFLADDSLLMAVGYRSHPVSMWSPLELHQLGECGAASANGVLDMAFNPNPEIDCVVVSYAQGDLCVYNYMTMGLDVRRPRMHAVSLACSQDGRTLVTGSSQGVIQIFQFDFKRAENLTLTPIYWVKASDSGIRSVAFSVDGLRFVSIGRRQCQLWEPAALVRKNNELENISEAIPLAQGTPGTAATQVKPRIMTPMVILDGKGILLGGKNDGSIWAFSANDGTELGVTHSHSRGVSVTRLLIAEPSQLIISADNSGRVLVARVIQQPGNTPSDICTKLPQVDTVLNRRFGAAITHLMVNKEADRLLVRGHDFDELWDLPSGNLIQTYPSDNESLAGVSSGVSTSFVPFSICRSAFQHPTKSHLFVVVGEDTARVFQWVDFAELTSTDGILLKRPHRPFTVSQLDTVSYHIGSDLVVEHHAPSLRHSGSLVVWPALAFDPISEVSGHPSESITLDTIETAVLVVLGVLEDSRLLFVDRDLWICSTELRGSLGLDASNVNTGFWPRPSPSPSGLDKSFPAHIGSSSVRTAPSLSGQARCGQTRRHFFALSEWRDGANKFSCTMLSPRITTPLHNRGLDFAFVYGHRIIIVEGGTDFSETVTINTSSAKSRSGIEEDTLQGEDISPTRLKSNETQWTVVSGSMHRRASAW